MRASGMPFVFHSETEGARMLNSLATAEVPPKASMISRGESGDLFMATSIGAPIARRQAAPIGYAYRIATMTPFHERVLFFLELAGGNQSELARVAGIAAPSVNDWLSGKSTSISLKPTLRIAKKWKLSPWWVAYGDGDKYLTSAGSAPTMDDETRKVIRFYERLREYCGLRFQFQESQAPL